MSQVYEQLFIFFYFSLLFCKSILLKDLWKIYAWNYALLRAELELASRSIYFMVSDGQVKKNENLVWSVE
jgi:hypothetical protein